MIDIILIGVAILSLLIALILNYYRFQFFGVHEGDAANNFSFNVSIFIPLVLLSVLLSLIVNYRISTNWKMRTILWMKLIPLIISCLIILLFIFQIIRIFRVSE
ncbi:hypothetical protein A9P82_06160 [Arachidicoccus ginsenosidimutans]|nr:hypothetical protein A9P82_06160 [Arachidicoccus sp. BS20]